MKDAIRYTAGVDSPGASLGGLPESALSTGYVNTSPKKADFWEPGYQREDDDGSNYVGDPWERRQTGACGRPNGNER